MKTSKYGLFFLEKIPEEYNVHTKPLVILKIQSKVCMCKEVEEN